MARLNPSSRLLRLLACATGLFATVASGLDAQTAGKPAVGSTIPKLVFGNGSKSRVFLACERALAMNLNGVVTTGDLSAACLCVDRAFEGALPEIPNDYAERFVIDGPEGPVLNLQGIFGVANGGNVPGPIKIRAQRLSWDSKVCVGKLPTRAQFYSQFADRWVNKPTSSSEYTGPLQTPIAGPAQESFNDVGGLLFVTMMHLRDVMDDIFFSEGMDVIKRGKSADEIAAANPDARMYVVLQCEYRVEAANGYNRSMMSLPYYFWYAPEVKPELAVTMRQLGPDHPAKRVRPATKSCPAKQPAP